MLRVEICEILNSSQTQNFLSAKIELRSNFVIRLDELSRIEKSCGIFDNIFGTKNFCSTGKVLTIGCIVLVAHCGLDRASVHGNIASAASRVKTHGVHH